MCVCVCVCLGGGALPRSDGPWLMELITAEGDSDDSRLHQSPAASVQMFAFANWATNMEF